MKDEVEVAAAIAAGPEDDKADKNKDKKIAYGEVKVKVGDRTFITRPEDVVESVADWCMSRSGLTDDSSERTLLDAFVTVARGRGFYAGRPADIQKAFDAFRTEKV